MVSKASSQVPLFAMPIHYNIRLKTYIPFKSGVDYGDRNFTFDGLVDIIVRIDRSTNRVILHSVDLHIQSLRVFDDVGGKMESSFSINNT